MVFFEIHADHQHPDRLQTILGQLRTDLINRKLTTEQCDFRVVRNGVDFVKAGKKDPFIRIAVTPDDLVEKIVQALQTYLPTCDCGIDIVAMPIFIPPGKETGRWYDPSDPLCASRHAKGGL